jgi:hypothetical protein
VSHHHCNNDSSFGWVLGLMGALIFYWMIGVIVVGIIWFLWATNSTWTTFPRRLARTLLIMLVLFFLL